MAPGHIAVQQDVEGASLPSRPWPAGSFAAGVAPLGMAVDDTGAEAPDLRFEAALDGCRS